MTDSEKLDLLLENVLGLNDKFSDLDQKVSDLDQKVTDLDQKVSDLDQKVTDLDQKVSMLEIKVTCIEQDMVDVKSDLRRLHREDNLILDEVERVHALLDLHKADISKHTA